MYIIICQNIDREFAKVILHFEQKLKFYGANMKLNQSQKKIMISGILIIIASILVWISFGAEIFTKTQVIVEKQDEFLGTTYKEWKDQFILGLDYTLGFIFIIVVLSSSLIYLKRKNI